MDVDPLAAPPVPGAAPATADWPGVQRVLERVRAHLGMDLAWVSQLSAGEQVIRAVSGDAAAMHVGVGQRTPAQESFCSRVVAGTLPPVVPDARRHPVTRELGVTRDLGIGSYVGVPLRAADGTAVGMVCCLDRGVSPSLGGDAVRVVALAADLVSDHLGGGAGVAEALDDGRGDAAERARHVRRVLDTGAVRMVFQPVVHLATREPLAYEALARFDDPGFTSPARAFAAATSAGLGVELELLAAGRALEQLPAVPGGAWLGVNLSAEALVDPRALDLLLPLSDLRISVEVTEHTQVHDYPALVGVTERLRSAGFQITVDDAGAGFASFRHVLRLRPTVIKLDIDIIRDVDTDPVRRALARSMVQFAEDTGAVLVAEGVETESEHAVLHELGVALGQGYLYGRPGPLPRGPVGGAPAERTLRLARSVIPGGGPQWTGTSNQTTLP